MALLDRYKKLKHKVTERKEPFDRFIALLEGETTWLTSPASTRYHLSEEHGLLRHSVGVAETLLRFREFLAPAITEESCVIVGLFHDAGKLGMPGTPLYLPNDNEWLVKNRGLRYTINPDTSPSLGRLLDSAYIRRRQSCHCER
jgi:23S rRNA maturation-related 3'-5' exoribonuclease YhaM